MRRIGLFPGTFDPVTLGHLDILNRALHLFDRMIVAVAHRHHKATLFTTDERMFLIRQSLAREQQSVVTVVPFEGLLVDFARRNKVSGIVRGLRFVSDFEYEFQMALMNQKLCPEIDTTFLMPTERFSYLNSSLVKEVAKNGGAVKGLVTPAVARALKRYFAHSRNEEDLFAGMATGSTGEAINGGSPHRLDVRARNGGPVSSRGPSRPAQGEAGSAKKNLRNPRGSGTGKGRES